MFSVEALVVYLNQDDVLYVSNTTVEHGSAHEITPDELSPAMKHQGFVFQDVLVYSAGELTSCQAQQNIALPDKKSLILIFKKKSNRYTRKSKSRSNQSTPLETPREPIPCS